MKKLLIGLLALGSISSFASSKIFKDNQGRCVMAYKDTVIAVKPIRGDNLGYGGLINSIEITTLKGESSVYIVSGSTDSGDNLFVRINGNALSKKLIYDDYRGIAFTSDGINLDGEANFSSYFKGSYAGAPDTTLICGNAHGEQRHSLNP